MNSTWKARMDHVNALRDRIANLESALQDAADIMIYASMVTPEPIRSRLLDGGTRMKGALDENPCAKISGRVEGSDHSCKACGLPIDNDECASALNERGSANYG